MGFIDTLKERAKANVKRIVVPETEDKRTGSYRENFKRRNCKGYPCW